MVPDAEHVHLIAVPQNETDLARAIGETHRRNTRRINFRKDWRGHLWQERFASFPMDENHLLAAIRYVEMNPVAAEMVVKPEEYRWSSARSHLEGTEDMLASSFPLHNLILDWKDLLHLSSEEELKILKRHEYTGRPLGHDSFVAKLEKTSGRVLRPQRPGPNKKQPVRNAVPATTLQDRQSERYIGWDNKKKRHDSSRRITIVMGNYVVVIGQNKQRNTGRFITAYVADSGWTIKKIRNGPRWE
jgi:putative transposase